MIRYVAFKLSVIAILLAMGLLSSCQVHVSTSEDWVVDGTHLDERHQEALSVDSWHPEGLTLHGHAGDVTVRWTSASAGDSDRIVATVHEETPGDASLRYERGVLEVLSASGREVALGEVEVVLSRPLSRLEVVTGAGDVEVEVIDRGWIAYLNDLHKGRHAGVVWTWFIDLFAIACLVFCVTGLILLKLHAAHRAMTWPMVTLGLVVPVVLLALFGIFNGADAQWLGILAWTYVGGRVAHMLCYYADQRLLRSLAFAIALLALLAMAVVGALG